MKKARVPLIIGLSFIVCTAIGMAADQSMNGRRFQASLSGDEEVPPVRTKAKGDIKFQYIRKGDQLTYQLAISDIKDVTAALIQKGKTGENGPPVLNLFTEPKKEDISGNLLADGKVEPYLLMGPLKGNSVNSLVQLIETREVYVNIQTKKCPQGEIGGQIE